MIGHANNGGAAGVLLDVSTTFPGNRIIAVVHTVLMPHHRI
jgi:hypothetical protein